MVVRSTSEPGLEYKERLVFIFRFAPLYHFRLSPLEDAMLFSTFNIAHLKKSGRPANLRRKIYRTICSSSHSNVVKAYTLSNSEMIPLYVPILLQSIECSVIDKKERFPSYHSFVYRSTNDDSHNPIISIEK